MSIAYVAATAKHRVLFRSEEDLVFIQKLSYRAEMQWSSPSGKGNGSPDYYQIRYKFEPHSYLMNYE